MPTPDSSPELFTAGDLARFCQVALKTIHNWAESGNIRYTRTRGKHMRFRRVDVVEFLRRFGYPIPDAIRTGRPRIAAVDGDLEALAALRRVLMLRFDFTAFIEPVDALVTIGTSQPDAVILDVRMPGLDGVRLLERLTAAEATAHIRTVVYSSQVNLQEVAMQAGARAFVMKGKLTELRESLEELTGLG